MGFFSRVLRLWFGLKTVITVSNWTKLANVLLFSAWTCLWELDQRDRNFLLLRPFLFPDLTSPFYFLSTLTNSFAGFGSGLGKPDNYSIRIFYIWNLRYFYMYETWEFFLLKMLQYWVIKMHRCTKFSHFLYLKCIWTEPCRLWTVTMSKNILVQNVILFHASNSSLFTNIYFATKHFGHLWLKIPDPKVRSVRRFHYQSINMFIYLLQSWWKTINQRKLNSEMDQVKMIISSVLNFNGFSINCKLVRFFRYSNALFQFNISCISEKPTH